MIRTNLRGRFAAIREAVPHFGEAGLALVPLPGCGDAHDRSRPVSISAAGARGLVEVAASDLDQAVVGVEFDLLTARDTDDADLESVAAAITAGLDTASSFDGRGVSLEALHDGD